MTDIREKLFPLIEKDLEEIEQEIRNHIDPYLDIVRDIAGHILFAGGKRLRPLLIVLAARICGYQGNYDKTVSVSLEYLHSATLLHDDLVDDAEKRRGETAAHHLWGASAAVLTGDFLLARALKLAANLKMPEIIDVVAGITEVMSQGEIHQMLQTGNTELSESEYLEIIRLKTAVLLEGACKIGAIMAGADREKIDALAGYGMNVGIAFQVADDLLDYTADSSLTGKKTGKDLEEGKMTLPLIYGLANAAPKDKEWMKRIVQKNDTEPDEFDRLNKLLVHYGGIRHSRETALHYIEKAKKSLDLFPQSKTKEIFVLIADYILERKE